MTDKEKIFADTYIKTLNYSTALQIAGYKNKNLVDAKNKLMARQEIAIYIKDGLMEKAENVICDENDVWKTIKRYLNTSATHPKIFVVDKTLVEKQMPIEPMVVLKACDMLAKLLGMYDRDKEDDNIELPD